MTQEDFVADLHELYQIRIGLMDELWYNLSPPNFSMRGMEIIKGIATTNKKGTKLTYNLTVVDVSNQYSYLQRLLEAESNLINEFIKFTGVGEEEIETLFSILKKTTEYFTSLIKFVLGRDKHKAKKRLLTAIQQKDFKVAEFLARSNLVRYKGVLDDAEFQTIINLIELIQKKDIIKLQEFLKSEEFSKIFLPDEIEFLNEVVGITVPILILTPTNSTAQNHLGKTSGEIEIVGSYHGTIKEALKIGKGEQNNIQLADTGVNDVVVGGEVDPQAKIVFTTEETVHDFALFKSEFNKNTTIKIIFVDSRSHELRESIWLTNCAKLMINEYEFDVSITSKPLPDEKKYKEQFPIVLSFEKEETKGIFKDIFEALRQRRFEDAKSQINERERNGVLSRDQQTILLDAVIYNIEGHNFKRAYDRLVVYKKYFEQAVFDELLSIIEELKEGETPPTPELQIIIDSPKPSPEGEPLVLYIGEKVENLEAHAEGTHKDRDDINREVKGYDFKWWIKQGEKSPFINIGRKNATSRYAITRDFEEGNATLGVIIQFNKSYVTHKEVPVLLKKRGEEGLLSREDVEKSLREEGDSAQEELERRRREGRHIIE